MRSAQWVLVVSAALFIAGIGFIVAAGRTPTAAAPVEAPPAVTPVANVRQIMNGIVMPNATRVYDSVGSVTTAAGVEDIAPKNDEEWSAVGDSAASLVEAGNLMLSGDRVLDRGEWVRMTRAFQDAGQAALKAASGKDVDGMFIAGGDLAMSCDKCHERYQRR